MRGSELIALLIDKKFKSIHDRITNPAVAAMVRRISHPIHRRQAARVFLEFFRLLHYLDHADPERLEEVSLKSTVLIFSLVTSETRFLLNFIERRVLKLLEPEDAAYPIYDSFVYCVPLELKKVLNTELLDLSVARQADNVRARVENSHGILKDCFQQSVVQLAQVFEPAIHGSDVFSDFTAKLDQSVLLRDDLARLVCAVRAFSNRKDEDSAKGMKDLMYRDWSGFEIFFIEILKCGSLPALLQIAHRFDTFLMTLFREVTKRSILSGIAGNKEVQIIEASL
jgi:hypothetical protein